MKAEDFIGKTIKSIYSEVEESADRVIDKAEFFISPYKDFGFSILNIDHDQFIVFNDKHEAVYEFSVYELYGAVLLENKTVIFYGHEEIVAVFATDDGSVNVQEFYTRW